MLLLGSATKSRKVSFAKKDQGRPDNSESRNLVLFRRAFPWRFSYVEEAWLAGCFGTHRRFIS